MVEKQGRGNFHSRRGMGQKMAGLRSQSVALERKNGSFGGQKTGFEGAGNCSLRVNERFVEGQ